MSLFSRTEQPWQEIAVKLRQDVERLVTKIQSIDLEERLSAAEIITTLYFHHLRINPHNPGWNDRDRFILGQSNSSLLLYASLGKAGFSPVDDLDAPQRIGKVVDGRLEGYEIPGMDMALGLVPSAKRPFIYLVGGNNRLWWWLSRQPRVVPLDQ